jgi:hypothetical protein
VSGTRNVRSHSRNEVGGLPILGISGFVNAQYRFVMNPTGDYTVHFADPDMWVPIVLKQTMSFTCNSFFQWQDILQVIIPRSSALASAASNGEHSGQDEGNTMCPICLSSPTAPRMTKCGHVRCISSVYCRVCANIRCI